MKNNHIKYFLKCGFYNNIIISIISNYILNLNSLEIDYISLYYLLKLKCNSSTINYNNYLFSSCISYENIICHGIPLKKKFKNKFLKFDLAINYKNLHSDSCYNSNFLYKKKNYYFKYLFFIIINFIQKKKTYFYINNIFLIKKKFFFNEDYCSHGIFKNLHNKLIININKKNHKIKNFDTFTIEPMFIFNNKNGYHFKEIFFSKKNNLSFQWEHTFFIIRKKNLISTLRKNEICFI